MVTTPEARQESNRITAVFRVQRDPYTYRSGVTVGRVVPEKIRSDEEHWDALSAFRVLFNGSLVSDRSVRSTRVNGWSDAGVRAVEQAKQRVDDALKARKDKRAAKAAFNFGRVLWDNHLYGSAEDAYLFGAAFQVGLATRAHFDLADTHLRGALFAELAKAKLTEGLETRTYDPSFALGETWPLFARFVGGNEYGTFSQMLVGTGLVLKTFSSLRTEMPFAEGFQARYHISEKTVTGMLKRELADLEAMREADIPVVTVHHVGKMSYLRDYIPGAVFAAIDHPLIGLSQYQRLDAKRRFYQRAMQITDAGLWEGATEGQMMGSMVYSLELQDWVVVDTLASARQQ